MAESGGAGPDRNLTQNFQIFSTLSILKEHIQVEKAIPRWKSVC